MEFNTLKLAANRKRGQFGPTVDAHKAAEKEDAMVRSVLAAARVASVEIELNAEQKKANERAMSKLRRESARALQRRIDRKELLSQAEFQNALGISGLSINADLSARRMFAVVGPNGELYYPSFYADGDLHRRDLENVAKVLGGVPAVSKYHFFTSKSTSLGAATPLEALKDGRLMRC